MPSLEVLSRTQRIVVLPNTSVSIVKEGPTGPKGDQGPRGLTGPTGPRGIAGDTVAASLYIPIDGDPTTVETSIDFTIAPTLDGEPLEPLRTHIEDDPHVSGDQGVLSLAVRHDADTSTVDTDGDYSALHTDSAGKLKVAGPLTDDELRATPIAVTGDFASDGLTNTELRATPVPISGTVTASGPVTDTQLRATPVPISGTVTASGPVTDTQLRATPVPVSGTITATTGDLTNTQLRATPVPVSGTIALDSTTLAALENTTITIDAGSLAALETINVANIAGTEFLEDVASANGDKGTFILGVRHDADTATVGTDGDYSALHTDSVGKLKVAGPLTDTQLRATPVPVSGTVTATTGGLTDTQLRATPLAVTGAGGGIQFAEDVAAANGDLGTFVLAMRHDADTATVGTDGDYSALHTDSSGKLKVTGGTSPATTGTASNVTNAVADTSVLASNSNRKGASIFNDDTVNTGAVVNIALGFTASATAFTAKIPPQGLYELPSNYTGTVRAYSSTATGILRVTELT